MSKFKEGDVVRLTSKAREQHRTMVEAEPELEWNSHFIRMVMLGDKAVVSGTDNSMIWLNDNAFWVSEEDLVLACADVAIQTNKATEEKGFLKAAYVKPKNGDTVYKVSRSEKGVKWVVVKTHRSMTGCLGAEYYYPENEAKTLLEDGNWEWLYDYSESVPASANSTPEHDAVAKPKHYQLIPEKGVEVIHVQDALGEKIDASGLLNANECSYYMQAIGYGLRFMDKNGLEDLKKMRWYLDRLVTSMEERNGN